METTVNSRIMLLKTELRLNTMDFCSRAKISNGTFYNIQNGENVNQKTLNNVIENLNINADWLIHGNGKMFNETPKEQPAQASWKEEAYRLINEQLQKKDEQIASLLAMLAKVNFLNPLTNEDPEIYNGLLKEAA